jgi:hypothetical protein
MRSATGLDMKVNALADAAWMERPPDLHLGRAEQVTLAPGGIEIGERALCHRPTYCSVLGATLDAGNPVAVGTELRSIQSLQLVVEPGGIEPLARRLVCWTLPRTPSAPKTKDAARSPEAAFYYSD